MSNQNTTDQTICNEMVTKIAKLAKLHLTEKESQQYEKDFEGILEMFHALDTLDLEKNKTAERLIIPAENCREDIPTEVDLSNLSQACDYYNTKTSYFDVPQFIGQDDE